MGALEASVSSVRGVVDAVGDGRMPKAQTVPQIIFVLALNALVIVDLRNQAVGLGRWSTAADGQVEPGVTQDAGGLGAQNVRVFVDLAVVDSRETL
jgi:hypothetical protein